MRFFRWLAFDAPREDTQLLPSRQPTPPNLTKLNPHRVLGVGSVLALTWFNVSGGTFGAEEIVSAGGPLPGFAVLLGMSVLWGMPVAFMTAELSTAFPDNGGYSIWVQQAFGNFWGFQESYWSWISGVTDNAVYPVLVYDSCVKYLWKSDLPPLLAYVIKLIFVLLFSLPNIFSVKIAGNSMVVLMVMVLIPFILLSLCALPHLHPHHLLESKSLHEIDWNLLLTTAFWNVNGFDCASTFAGEVFSPHRTYPLAMGGAVVAVLLTYAFPLGAAVAVNRPDWHEWEDGYFTQIADDIGGRWLGVLMVFCSVVSNLGLFGAELFEDSFQLMGMAQTGMMPRWFAARSRFRTPLRSIALSLVLICGLISFDFTSILVIQNFLYCLAQCLEILACVRLRRSRPELKRPSKWFVVPMPLLIVPFGVSVVMIAVSLLSSVRTTIINIGSFLVGLLLYWVLKKTSSGTSESSEHTNYQTQQTEDGLQSPIHNISEPTPKD